MQIGYRIREKFYFTYSTFKLDVSRKKEKNIYSNILTRNEKIGVRYKNILNRTVVRRTCCLQAINTISLTPSTI